MFLSLTTARHFISNKNKQMILHYEDVLRDNGPLVVDGMLLRIHWLPA